MLRRLAVFSGGWTLEAAETLYASLVKKHPDWEDAWFRLGYLRLQRNDFNGRTHAMLDAQKAAAVSPRAALRAIHNRRQISGNEFPALLLRTVWTQ